MKMKVLLAALTGLMTASAVNAATLNYTLSLNDNGAGVVTPGSFAVYVTDTAAAGTTNGGTNGGIVGFQFILTGQTTSSNQSPRLTFSDSNGVLEDRTKGFTLLRANGSTGVATTGSQNTTGTYTPIYGFGQTPGTLSTPIAGYDTTSGSTRPTYLVPLLVATGTFGATTPTIGVNGANGGVVWANTTSTTAVAVLANDTSFSTVNLSGPAIPEPASLAVLGVAGIGALARRRKIA